MTQIDSLILQYQKKSLERHANILGINYSDCIESLCLQISQQENHTRICYQEFVKYGVELNLDFPQPLRNEIDFWKYKLRHAEKIISICTDLVSKLHTNQKLDFSVNFLKTHLEDAFEESFSNLSVKELLNKIPLVLSFEANFNATASLRNFELPFPHIRYYAFTNLFMRAIIFTLINNSFCFNNSPFLFKFRETKDIVPDSRNAEIYKTVEYLLTGIDSGWVYIMLDKVPCYNPFLTGNLIYAAKMITLIAEMSILLHEIGHHVLGHFNFNGESWDKEYEADIFAAKCLSQLEWPVPFIFTGIVTAYKVIRHLCEASDTHPSPHIRLCKIFETMNFLIADMEVKELGFSRICDPLDLFFYEKIGMSFLDARSRILAKG